MAATHHRGSLPFLHRSGSISRPDASDAMFSPQSPNFITKIRARKQSTTRDSITPTEAVWFLSLPDKVKRQHFTKEEQILIRARSELAILDASPETLTHVEDAHPRPHVRTKSVAYESTSSISPLPSPSLMPSMPPLSNRHSMALEHLRSRPTQWHASPEVLQQDKFQQHLQPQLVPPQQTFLRSPTLNFGTWENNNASSQSLDTPRPNTGRSMSQTSQRAGPPPPLNIQKPLYLKDPSTKALLKDCVSNGRFEETLIFGFPAINQGLRAPPVLYDAVSPGTQIRETWLDSSVYGEDDEDREELSSADEIEPPTPDSFIQPQIIRRKSDYFSVNSQEDDAAPSPTIVRHGSNTSYFEELMKRDMTLRMTLTKPELRASEEELYGWQDEQEEEVEPLGLEKDPLALADLTFSDDVTGSNGAFAQALSKKKGIKAFWFPK